MHTPLERLGWGPAVGARIPEGPSDHAHAVLPGSVGGAPVEDLDTDDAGDLYRGVRPSPLTFAVVGEVRDPESAQCSESSRKYPP